MWGLDLRQDGLEARNLGLVLSSFVSGADRGQPFNRSSKSLRPRAQQQLGWRTGRQSGVEEIDPIQLSTTVSLEKPQNLEAHAMRLSPKPQRRASCEGQ